MGELPTGIVTFLFTDIEGSTQLLNRLGDRYADLLAEHHGILRTVLAKYDGYEVGTEGDAFFIAFARAADAIAAAGAAQKELFEHQWPLNNTLLVRMGLHTGEPVCSGDNYAGLDVHRAARIGAAAHGGLPDGRGPRPPADRRANRARPCASDDHADLPHAPKGRGDPPGRTHLP